MEKNYTVSFIPNQRPREDIINIAQINTWLPQDGIAANYLV